MAFFIWLFILLLGVIWLFYIMGYMAFGVVGFGDVLEVIWLFGFLGLTESPLGRSGMI